MRQRYVYPTNDIPALWYSRKQESARNQQGNFYFEGSIIYSYHDSYPIARLLDNGYIFIRDHTYSVTTSGHLRLVEYVVPGQLLIYVPSVLAEPSLDLLNEIRNREQTNSGVNGIMESLGKFQRARRQYTKEYWISSLNDLKRQYNLVAGMIGQPEFRFDPVLTCKLRLKGFDI